MPPFVSDEKITPSLIVPNGAGPLVEMGDHRITLKVSSAQTGGALACGVMVVDVDGGVPLHVHTHEDEFFYVLEGRFQIQIGDRTVEVGPGDCAFGPRGVPHCWRCLGPEKGRIFGLVSPAANFEGFAAAASQLRMNPAGPPDPAAFAALSARYGIRTL